MKTTELLIECPAPYCLYMTTHTHGWRQLSPFSWDDKKNALLMSIRINGKSLDIKTRQHDSLIKVKVHSAAGLTGTDENDIKKTISGILDLASDTSCLRKLAEKTGQKYTALVNSGGGRLLKAGTLWENAAKTLFTTNCSWALTRKISGRICSDDFSSQTPSGKFPFPDAERVARYSADELKSLIPIGYRAPFLKALAERFADDPTLSGISTGEADYDSAKKIIRQLKGFGEYACIHLLTLCGFYRDIPVDSVVRTYLLNTHGITRPEAFIETQYGDWGEYRWWKFKFETMINNGNRP